MSSPEKKEKFMDKLKKPFKSHSRTSSESDTNTGRRKSIGSIKRMSISGKHSDKEKDPGTRRSGSIGSVSNITNQTGGTSGTSGSGAATASTSEQPEHVKIIELAYIEGQKSAESKFGKKMRSGYLPWNHHHHDSPHHDHDSTVVQSTSVGNVLTSPPKPVTVPIDKDVGDFSNFKHPTHDTVVRDDDEYQDKKALQSNSNPLYSNEAEPTKGTGYFYDPKDTQGGEYKNLNADKYNEETQAKYKEFDHLKTKPTKHQQEEDTKRQEQKQRDKTYVANEKGFNEDVKYQSQFSTDKASLDPKQTHRENKSAFNHGGISQILGQHKSAVSTDNASTAAIYSGSREATPNIAASSSAGKTSKDTEYLPTSRDRNDNYNDNANAKNNNNNTGIIAGTAAAVGGIAAAVGLSNRGGKDEQDVNSPIQGRDLRFDDGDYNSKNKGVANTDGTTTYADYIPQKSNTSTQRTDPDIEKTIGTAGAAGIVAGNSDKNSDSSKLKNIATTPSGNVYTNSYHDPKINSEKYKPTHYNDKNFDYDTEVAKLDQEIESTQAEIDKLRNQPDISPNEQRFAGSSSAKIVGAAAAAGVAAGSQTRSAGSDSNTANIIGAAGADGVASGVDNQKQRSENVNSSSNYDTPISSVTAGTVFDRSKNTSGTSSGAHHETSILPITSGTVYDSNTNRDKQDNSKTRNAAIAGASTAAAAAATVGARRQSHSDEAYEQGVLKGAYVEGVFKEAYDEGYSKGKAAPHKTIKQVYEAGIAKAGYDVGHTHGKIAKKADEIIEDDIDKAAYEAGVLKAAHEAGVHNASHEAGFVKAAHDLVVSKAAYEAGNLHGKSKHHPHIKEAFDAGVLKAAYDAGHKEGKLNKPQVKKGSSQGESLIETAEKYYDDVAEAPTHDEINPIGIVKPLTGSSDIKGEVQPIPGMITTTANHARDLPNTTANTGSISSRDVGDAQVAMGNNHSTTKRDIGIVGGITAGAAAGAAALGHSSTKSDHSVHSGTSGNTKNTESLIETAERHFDDVSNAPSYKGNENDASISANPSDITGEVQPIPGLVTTTATNARDLRNATTYKGVDTSVVDQAYKEGRKTGKIVDQAHIKGANVSSNVESNSSSKWPQDISTSEKKVINAAYLEGGKNAAYDQGHKVGASETGTVEATKDVSAIHGHNKGAVAGAAGVVGAAGAAGAAAAVSSHRNETKKDSQASPTELFESSHAKDDEEETHSDVIVSVQGTRDNAEATRIAQRAVEQLKTQRPEILEIAKELKINYQTGIISDEFGQKVARVAGFGGPLEGRYVNLAEKDDTSRAYTGISSTSSVGPTSSTKSGFLEEFDGNTQHLDNADVTEVGNGNTVTKNVSSNTSTLSNKEFRSSSLNSNEEGRSASSNSVKEKRSPSFNSHDDDHLSHGFADSRRLSDPKLAGIFAGGQNQGHLSKQSNTMSSSPLHESHLPKGALGPDTSDTSCSSYTYDDNKDLKVIQENADVPRNSSSNITNSEPKITQKEPKSPYKIPGSFIP